MSNSKAKIPRITLRAGKQLILTDHDWQEIETAYGEAIPLQVRAQIIQLSERFLCFSGAQTGSMNDAIQRATRLRQCAQSFVTAVNERAVGDVIREYVDDQMALGNALLNDGDAARKYVCEISAELSRFTMTCEWTLKEMEQASQYNFWPDGWHWDGWIRRLTDILGSHNLPTGARKDTDKNRSDRASSFVELVRAFQHHIPREHTRSQHSKAALAGAIHKARQQSKPTAARRKARAKQSGRKTMHAR